MQPAYYAALAEVAHKPIPAMGLRPRSESLGHNLVHSPRLIDLYLSGLARNAIRVAQNADQKALLRPVDGRVRRKPSLGSNLGATLARQTRVSESHEIRVTVPHG